MNEPRTDSSLTGRIRQLEAENAYLKDTNRILDRTIVQYQSFLESTDDIILICDQTGRPLIWNRACETLIKELFEIDITPDSEIFGKQTVGGNIFIENSLVEKILSGENCKTEYRIVADPELIRFLEISFSPIYDGPHIIGCSMRARDITKQKEAEDTLTIFKQAVDGAADAIGMSTSRGRHYYQNASFDHLFGDIGSDPPTTLYADEQTGREVFATITGGSPWIGEVEMNSKDGRRLFIFLRAYPVKDSNGNVRRLVGVHTNITERKLAEIELHNHREHLRELVKERTRELRESEERFRQISDTIDDVFYLYSDDYRKVYYVSPGYEKIWGKNPRSLYDDPWIFLASVHQDDRQWVAKHKKKILKAHDFEDTSIEYRIIGKDGGIKWIRDEMFPVYDLNGDLTRIAGSAREITRRKKAEEELRRSREQSRQLSRYLQHAVEDERKRIAREIHDDLGQTLIAMKMGLASCVTKIPQDLHQLKKTISDMEQTIDRMIQSIKIMISDLRAGPLADLGLEPAIEWLANNFFKGAGRKITVTLDTESFDMGPDRSMAMFRIFQETLSNILRHSRATKVTIRLFKNRTHAVLSVSDNGVGMKNTDTLPDSSYGIMGMKERARFYDGDLFVKSTPGTGVTITARIPVDSDIK